MTRAFARGGGPLGPLVVAVLCMAGLAWTRWLDPPPALEGTPTAPPVASPEARALLGGLSEGERLVGWTVQAIDGPHDGVIRIELGRDRVRFSLMVARKGRMPEAAPVETEHHAIFYGHADPPDTRLPPNTIRATTHALANRIRAAEATVTVEGM